MKKIIGSLMMLGLLASSQAVLAAEHSNKGKGEVHRATPAKPAVPSADRTHRTEPATPAIPAKRK